MHIAIGRKLGLRVALAVALTTVTGLACAQSAEYRQGYDQGYRDGVDAQSHANHGGAIGHIIIEEAHYGKRDQGFCDVRDVIQHQIGWRRHFDIHVSNDLCGDPAPNEVKHLRVRYRCGDSQPTQAEAPEGSIMALSCQ